MHNVGLRQRIEALEKRLEIVERRGLRTLKTVTVTKRDDRGLGRPQEVAIEEMHLLDPAQAWITAGERAELVQMATVVNQHLVTLINTITHAIELAAKADKRAEHADALAYDAIDA